MFGKLFSGAKRVVDNVQNLDLLQAIGAASLYVASGDGIDNKEFDQLRVSIATNKALTSFSSAQVDSVLNNYRLQLEQSPRMGKLAMRKEIQEITDDRERETVFAVACDVADQNGIDATEKARLLEVAEWLRVNPADFGL